MVSPASIMPFPLLSTGSPAVLSRVNAGAPGTLTSAVAGGEVTGGAPGGVPDAAAVLVTAPASTSACVSEYVAVQAVAACGARLVTGQEISGRVPVPENEISSTVIAVRSTLPVL